MVDIIGYGEDALTYWALSSRLDQILKDLGDPTEPKDCLVLYRPSFGRRGGPNSSQFGEFDAILATPECVYLIESKWGGSSELKDGVITLRPEQALRHDIFKWYLEAWTTGYSNWHTFVERNVDGFMEYFDKRIAPPGSALARNLEHILRTLQGYSTNIQNVLLYFYRGDYGPPGKVDPATFKLVNCRYETIGGTEYFKLADST